MLLRGKRRPLKPNHTQILVFYFSPPLSPFFCISHVIIKFYANIFYANIYGHNENHYGKYQLKSVLYMWPTRQQLIMQRKP